MRIGKQVTYNKSYGEFWMSDIQMKTHGTKQKKLIRCLRNVTLNWLPRFASHVNHTKTDKEKFDKGFPSGTWKDSLRLNGGKTSEIILETAYSGKDTVEMDKYFLK